MPVSKTSEAPHESALGQLKALLSRRVVEGGDSGWWRALVPALAIVAVLFAALNVRSATDEAGRAIDRAADAREMAVAVDRLALLSRAELAGGQRGRADELAAARGTVSTQTARLGRGNADGAGAEVARQAAAAERALGAALVPDASRADSRRATATLTALQPSARALSDRLGAAAERADDRAARTLTLTLLGALILVSLLLGSFWSRRNAVDAKRRERRFQALLRNSSDLVVVVDPSTLNIRYATPAVERMLGYDAEAVTGSSLTDLTHPEDRGVLADECARCAKAKTATRPTAGLRCTTPAAP